MTSFLEEACHEQAKLFLEPFSTGSSHRTFGSVDGGITPLNAIEYSTVHDRIKYEDEELCDVVPMEAMQLLLGRPWQFDRRATHDGNLVALVPLTPSQVLEDQQFLQSEIERRVLEKGNNK